MRIEPQKIVLKNGKNCILRNATIKDAEQMIAFLKQTAGETYFLTRYPEEVRFTTEQEQDILQEKLESDRNLMVVAEVDGEIVGSCGLNALGDQQKIRHRCTVGIALLEKVWNQGIGSALLGFVSQQAKEMGYEQMELEVVSQNTRAISLYEKLGFEKYGTRPHAMKLKDGSYVDEHLMIKWL